MCGLKKTMLAIFVFSSSTAMAGTMGAICTDGKATTPCAHSSWSFGAEALYLQPNYSSNLYLVSHTNPITRATEYSALKAQWAWGFKIEGAYYFRTGTDLNINWYHYNQTTHDFANENGSFATPTILTRKINTSLTPKWDAVNAELGQLVQFGDFEKIRFHGGAQYVHLKNITVVDGAPLMPESFNSQFNGFGPRIGADMSYDLNHHFTLYANGASALLVGTNQFSTVTTGILYIPGSSFGSSTTIIPEIEGKLGAKYTYALPNGNLSLDVGYLWLDYINVYGVRSSLAPAITASPSANTSNRTLNATTDLTLQGPYIGLKWLG